jgi:CubicO group peptidase (beta-lactamase class C family)
MHHKKHHKKMNPWIPVFVILLLIIVVGLEIYLLFFQQPTTSITTQETSESSIQATQSSETLTDSAKNAENFNQTVEPHSTLAKELQQKLIDKKFTGTALVVHQGNIVLQKGFGHANVAESRPNTDQSTFQIGSIQKALTAVLVLQQVQKNQLALDQTLNNFYPSVPGSEKITIRQLLSMRSGLYQKDYPTEMMSDDDFLHFSITHAQMGNYGKYKYDGVNYRILAGVLERVTNQTYRELFNQAFVQNAKLMHTTFYDDFLTSFNRTYAYENVAGKDFGDEIMDNHLTFDQEVGTGNVAMTVGDLYLFYAHLFEGDFISKQLMSELWTPDTETKYMGGLYNFPSYIKGHGSEAGFESNALFSKDQQDAVILLSNQHPKDKTNSDLANALFNLLGPYQA